MSSTGSSTRLAPWLEQAWLARYLDRKLTGEEEAWFEAYVLEIPELLAMLDTDSTLRDAVFVEGRLTGVTGPAARTDENGALSTARPVATAQTGFENRQRTGTRRRRRAASWAAVAATLIVGLGIGWFSQRFIGPGAEQSLIASPTRIVFDTMRGGSPSRRVEHANSGSPYVLVEVAVPPGAQDISVKIGDHSTRKLTPSPDGFVSFLVDRRFITNDHGVVLRYSSLSRPVTLVLDVSDVKRRPQ